MNLRISDLRFRILSPPTREREERWRFRIPNSEFRIRRWLLSAVAILIAFAPLTANAKLAVFVDGRVLKIDDARLEGSEIVLDLKGGGTLRVSAVRVDRVIADEVVELQRNQPFGEIDCPVSWSDVELPKDLPYRDFVASAARSNDLDPWLVASVVQTESAFDPRAVSRAGAAGLMQLMPAAAAEREVRPGRKPPRRYRALTHHARPF